jgi:hypothetical protein
MSIQAMQVHSRFRFFEGASISELNTRIRMFTAGGAIAVKSLSLEHVASTDSWLLLLGYNDHQPGYPIKLTEVIAGPHPSGDDSDQLGLSLDHQAAEAGEVICQTMYVDKDNMVHVVFVQTVYVG